MPFNLKCLNRRLGKGGAMPAIYASILWLFFLDPNRNARPHHPIAAIFAACTVVGIALAVARFVCRRRRTAA